MAQEDYLSGSAFGQVAGSLLASRRKRDKKEFRRALLASAIFEGLGAAQLQQKQGIVDAANDVNEKYTDIFTDNKELYQNQAANRAKYQSYIADKTQYVNKTAQELFNNDPGIQNQLGFDAFKKLNTNELTPESYDRAVEVFNAYKEKAEYDVKQLGLNPAVSISTFTKFNEKAQKAYRDALAEVKDDPTKKGLIRAAFNKIFGTAPDGTKRFGMAERAELIDAREESEALMVAQKNIVTCVIDPKEKEEEKINSTSNTNDKANNILNSMPSLNNPEEFKLTTNKEQLKLDKEAFMKKVNAPDYTLTVDDINKAVEVNYPVPGFSGLASLLTSDRDLLIQTSTKVKAAIANGQNPWDQGVLNQSERRVWSIATNQDLNARQNSDENLRLTQAKMRELPSVDYDDVNKLYNDENTKATVEAAILSEVEKDTRLEKIYNDHISQATKDSTTRHVIEGALLAMEKQKGLGFGDAVRQTIGVQMIGFYQFQEDPSSFWRVGTWFSDETHAHEYVDINAYRHMEREIKTEDDAGLAVYYMNNHRYIQNLPIGDSEDTLSPNKIGKSFIEGDYEFSVINIAPDGSPEQLLWDYEYIGN